MRFIIPLFFLITILHGYQCAPFEDWMQGFDEGMRQLDESMRQMDQEMEKMNQQMDQDMGKMNQDMAQDMEKMDQSMKRMNQQMDQEMQKMNQELQGSFQEIKNLFNAPVGKNGENPVVDFLGSTLFDGFDSNGNRVYNYVETTRTNNIERQTRKHLNPVTKKIETSHYVRDLTKPNSEFVLENNES